MSREKVLEAALRDEAEAACKAYVAVGPFTYNIGFVDGYLAGYRRAMALSAGAVEAAYIEGAKVAEGNVLGFRAREGWLNSKARASLPKQEEQKR